MRLVEYKLEYNVEFMRVRYIADTIYPGAEDS